ncbi:hypothetical protein [Mesorhizobium sp. YM1C-6-2]|uniref:hypothetical protein n=1 Tax=Mesorhizobium sp. YM1C-6-2 TaxID=1827501 RepID=UPI00160319E9|nr:hypothetical protein [Mesorhizobium sp. YM1C-6-2]
MPALKDAEHERMAQELAEGRSADEASAKAGYSHIAEWLSAWVQRELQGRVSELQKKPIQKVPQHDSRL